MTAGSSNNLFNNLPGTPAPAIATAETDAALVAAAADQEAGKGADDADDVSEAPSVNELDMLKSRARVMGIAFSNNIKVETLRAKISAKLNDEPDPAQGNDGDEEGINAPAAAAPAPVVTPAPVAAPVGGSLLAQIATMSAEEKAAMLHLLGGSPTPAAPVAAPTPVVGESKLSRDIALRKEITDREMALVRVRIQNLDPKKANLPGEILTVANEWLGTVSKFIPYGEATDDGYHVPVCLLNQLRERTFLQIRTVKNKNGRGTTTTTADVREFAIEVLPPLTVDELGKLAAAQAAAAGN